MHAFTHFYLEHAATIICTELIQTVKQSGLLGGNFFSDAMNSGTWKRR